MSESDSFNTNVGTQRISIFMVNMLVNLVKNMQNEGGEYCRE